MKKDKFLTVFAVYDEETQLILKKYQDAIISLGNKGTQTMDIPFHITLGSFPTKCEQELIDRIKTACSENFEFAIDLPRIGCFDNHVLFIEPTPNASLMHLHSLFDNNYPYGFPYHAHTTMFCGMKNEVVDAKELLSSIFTPLTAKIVGIQMGEFFPTRMIIAKDLKKPN